MRRSEPTELIRAIIADQERLRRLIEGLGLDHALVDDVLQETALAAVTNPPRQDWDAQRWLTGVARNLARKVLRTRRNQRLREQARARSELETADSASPGLVHAEEDLLKAVFSLTDLYREVILLRYFQNLPPRAIAVQLVLPVATVKTRLKRALQQLRNQMDPDRDARLENWPKPLLVGVLPGLKHLRHAPLRTLAAAALFVAAIWGTLSIVSSRPGESPASAGSPADQIGRNRPPGSEREADPARHRPLHAEGTRAAVAPAPWVVFGSLALEDGTGVGQAVVSLHSCGQAGTAVTTTSGRFVITMQRAAPSALEAMSGLREGQAGIAAPGLAVVIDGPVPRVPRVGRETRTSSWIIRLPDVSTLAARIESADGRPIESAELFVTNYRSGMISVSGPFRSDAQGIVRVMASLEGACAVRLAPLKRIGRPSLWPMRPGLGFNVENGADVDIGTLRMGRLATLELEVVDADRGHPVSGSTASLGRCPIRGTPLRCPPTDEHGVTAIEHVPGEHRIHVTLEDHVLADMLAVSTGSKVTLLPGRTTRVRLRVRRRVDVSPAPWRSPIWRLSVTDPYGYPLSGARVAGSGGVFETDGHGIVRFATRPIGTLKITRAGFQPHHIERFAPSPSGQMTVSLSTRSWHELELVDAEGVPVTNAIAVPFNARIATGALMATMGHFPLRDARGLHRLPVTPRSNAPPGILPGSLSFMLYSRGVGFARLAAEELARPGQRKRATLRPLTTLRGRILDERHHPVPDVLVYSGTTDLPLWLGMRALGSGILDEECKPFEGQRFLGFSRSRSDGSFELPGASENGLLVAMKPFDAGAIRSYVRAEDVQTVTLQPGPHVILERATAVRPGHAMGFFSAHPTIFLWMVSEWPAGSSTHDVRLPLRIDWQWSAGDGGATGTPARGILPRGRLEERIVIDR